MLRRATSTQSWARRYLTTNKEPYKRSLSMSDNALKDLFFKTTHKRNGLPKPSVAIAGATGAVGIEMLRCLEERNFPLHSLRVFAHPSEKGDIINYRGSDLSCETVTEGCFDNVDIALFSAGGDFSEEWAPKAAASDCIVVDNSSVFRMDPNVPLIVPEVNAHAVTAHQNILANPNCTTILMNVPVWPLHQAFGVERAVVATYQAASGAGLDAMRELEQQAADFVNGDPLTQTIFERQYIFNLFCHNSPQYLDNGYNEEVS